MSRVRIGQILLEEGLITSEQLDIGLTYQKSQGGRLASCLLTLGFVREDDAARVLGAQCGTPHVRLSDCVVDQETLRLIPRHIASKHHVMPLERKGATLKVALVDPRNLGVLDALKFVTNCPNIHAHIAVETQVQQAIDKHYGTLQDVELSEVFQTLSSIGPSSIQVLSDEQSSADGNLIARESEDAPVIKLVNWILAEAFNREASDIHVEPFEDEFRIRFRIDGVLQTIPQLTVALKLKDSICSRIKIMAAMDITERRQPQDGRIKMRLRKGNDWKTLDFRAASLPTIYGEKIVLRLLDRDNLTLDMSRLGFEQESLEKLKSAIQKPVGMVLVTGPTGSGKTNTLYSALSILNKPDVNITTVEDPVEIQLPGINQVHVREQIGLTFAKVLRSFLRQDPDVILVGEMRDQETAGIAVKAALTGHLVLTSLHTNDAPSTVFRLLDMGLERFQVATSVHLICAQRLVRRICKQCKKEIAPPSRDALINFGFDPSQVHSIRIFRGIGCNACSGTGYRGRIGLFEVMEINDELRDAIMIKASEADLRRKAVANGLITLRQSGLVKILEEITTIEEVARETV